MAWLKRLANFSGQQPKHQLHTVQVHHATADTDPYSEEVNCLMEDLPPPPRAESIDQHLNAAGQFCKFIHRLLFVLNFQIR